MRAYSGGGRTRDACTDLKSCAGYPQSYPPNILISSKVFHPRRQGKQRVTVCLLVSACLAMLTGCARLFGWELHAPGLLSESFYHEVTARPERVALYFPPDLIQYRSQDRGGALADPQLYHVGEALAPMLLEGFQVAFQELVFLEVEPTPDILKRYGIPHLVVVRVKEFANRVTRRGQRLALVTEALVLDENLTTVSRFEARGMSDARAVFRKKGGPEVNLNAAVERNVLAIIQYVQDGIRTGIWEAGT